MDKDIKTTLILVGLILIIIIGIISMLIFFSISNKNKAIQESSIKEEYNNLNLAIDEKIIEQELLIDKYSSYQNYSCKFNEADTITFKYPNDWSARSDSSIVNYSNGSFISCVCILDDKNIIQLNANDFLIEFSENMKIENAQIKTINIDNEIINIIESDKIDYTEYYYPIIRGNYIYNLVVGLPKNIMSEKLIETRDNIFFSVKII